MYYHSATNILNSISNILLIVVISACSLVQCCNLSAVDNVSVRRLREYIRIDTSKTENIQYAVEWWREQVSSSGLAMQVYYPSSQPVCVITLPGANPALPSIMLNTHMDVVKADDFSEWSHPPFAANIDENGNIVGRGTQDTKSLAVQQFETLLYFHRHNITLPRTIHMTLMPDEETGGYNGMQAFVKTEAFRKLNVGFALDEGLTFNEDTFYVTNVDKRRWFLNITIEGSGGHGSKMTEHVAVTKLTRLLNSISTFRVEQIHRQEKAHRNDAGAFTSVNVNVINGGSQVNVIPVTFNILVDMRLCASCYADEYNKMIQSWLRDANITSELQFITKEDIVKTTSTDTSDVFWMAMVDVARNELGRNIESVMCPATSDMIHLRALGYPALGFSPNLLMERRMHNRNEYISIDSFLNGLSYYRSFVKKLASVV